MDIAHLVQSSVAPVFLLSGVAATLAVLTAREREVLALVAEGRSNNGIASRLWVSEGAVEKHVRSILAKLGYSTRTEIATWSLRRTTF